MTEQQKETLFENIYGTSKGPLNYRDLQLLNAAQQAGTLDTGYNTASRHLRNLVRTGRMGMAAKAGPTYHTSQLAASTGGEDYFGNSVYDEAIVGNDLDTVTISDARADNQSWVAKIGSGVVKGTVLAATTFADGVFGTFAGIGNILAGNTENGILNAFINNPFSRAMQEINEKVEGWLPNYYSQAELESPWYTNIFTANFIGDKFLKNLGFAIGAAYSGKVNAGMMSKAMGMNKVRDAFKGAVVTASGKTLNNSDNIMRAYLQGDALMDGTKITADLAAAAKKMKRADMLLKTYGAVTAAMGEGRIEAISGSNEWYKLHATQIEDYRNVQYKEAEDALYKEHPEYFATDALGNRVLVNQQGQAALNSAKQSIDSQYEQGLAKLNDDRAKMANIIFAANVPVLAGNNLYQFGRFMSGGYNAGRLANSLAKGEIGKAVVNKTPQRMALAKALGVPLMEAQEEMTQQWIQNVPGEKYASELNNFYGAKIDPDAEAETIGWMKAVGQGFLDSYGSMKQWEQGFIGALTGALGAPKIHFRNAEGKFRPSITNEGELYKGIQDYRNLKKQAQEVVDALNNSKFKNYYQGLIRHNKLQKDMDVALERGDRFEYKNAESSQIISDAVMFNKAGRLQELYDEIDNAGQVRLEDVEDIRAAATKKEGKSIFEDMSDQEVVDFIQKQAVGVRAIVDNYVKNSANLKTLYGENISEDVLEELTWMMGQIDDWESRGSSILKSMRESLQNKSSELKDRFGVDIDVILNNYYDFSKAFIGESNLVDAINDVVEDKNLTVQEQRDKIQELIKQKNIAKSDSGLKLGRDIRHIRAKAKTKLAEVKKLADAYINAAESGEAATTLNKIHHEYGRALAELQHDFNEYFFDENGNTKEDPENLGQEFSNHLIKLQEETVDSEYANNLRGAVRELEKKAEMYMMQQEYLESGQWASNREGFARARQQEEASALRSQIVALTEVLNDPNNQLINPINIKQLGEQFGDLIKIVAARSEFIKTYNALSQHPESFTDAALKAMNAAAEKMEQKVVDTLVTDITSKATDLASLRETIKGHSKTTISKSLEAIKSSEGNKELKEVIKNYEDLEELSETFEKWHIQEEQSPALLTAINVVEDAISSANSRKEVFKIINAFLKNKEIVPEVKIEVQRFVDRYKENRDSKKSTKKDENKAEKELQKKSPKNSKLQKELDEELKQYEEEEEEEEEEDNKKSSPKPKKQRKYNNAISALLDDDQDTPPEKIEVSDNDSIIIDDSNVNSFIEDLDNDSLINLSQGKYSSVSVLEESLGVKIDDDYNTEDLLIQLQEKANKVINDRKTETEEETKKRQEQIEVKRKKEQPKPVKHIKKILDIKDEDGNSLEIENFRDFVENVIPELSDDILKQLATGEYIIKGLHEDGNDNVFAASYAAFSQNELDRRKNPLVHTEEQDETAADELYEEEYSGDDALSSWAVTQYQITPLKNTAERKAVLYESHMTTALQSLGAFEFVDNGSLGVLFNKDQEIPIHFIYATDITSLEHTPLLAIELTDEIEDIVDPINPITIDNKRYQVVGSLGMHRKNAQSQKAYNFLKKRLDSEYADSDTEGSYWISKNTHSQIRHFYSGRMVKSDEKNKVEKRSLKNVLKVEIPHFGIYYSDNNFKTPGLDQDVEHIVPLNTNNSNPREGSLWLMTREADGRYYPKYLEIGRFDEYDLSEHENAPIIEDLKKSLEILVDPTQSTINRMLARDDIENTLYFKEGNKLWFDEDSGRVHITGFQNNEDITTGENIEEDVESLLDALQDPELSLRFNIKPAELSNPDYVEKILNSDIITTDLLYPHNVNASFDIYPVNNEGEPIIDEDMDRRGHTGYRGINNSYARETLYHNGSVYYLDSDGNYIDGEDTTITDQDLIDELKLIAKIKNKEVSPLPGTNMYEGHYFDGSAFGIINNKVVSEERYEELKQQSRIKIKQQKERKAIYDIVPSKQVKNSREMQDDENAEFDWVPVVQNSEEDEVSEGGDTEDMSSDWISATDQAAESQDTFDDTEDMDWIAVEEEEGVSDTSSESSNSTDIVMDDTHLGKSGEEESMPANLETLLKSRDIRSMVREAAEALGTSDIKGIISTIQNHPTKFPKLEYINQNNIKEVLDDIINKCYLI